MVNVVGSRDDYSRWKPEDKQDYLTLQELCDRVGRQRRWMLELEGRGELPKPIRYKVGNLRVRLYSPQQVRKIEAMFRAIDQAKEKSKRDPEKRKHAKYMREYRERKREENANAHS